MRYITILLLLGLSLNSFSQKLDTININSLQVPNSPGFQLLDVSPNSIERPTSPKQFAVSLLNASTSGSVIPKNFAMEFCPYWFIKLKHESIEKYLNVGKKNYFSGIGKKLAISMTSVYNDSTTGSLLKNTNYISIGLRTNILTIRSKKANQNIENLMKTMVIRQGILGVYHGVPKPPDTIYSLLNKDSSYQYALNQERKLLTVPSLLQIDIAAAYSVAFNNNNFTAERFNRAAAWATITFTPIASQIGGNLSILGVAKLMDDNAMLDTSKGIFLQTTTFDFGASLNYSLNNLSVSLEHLERNYINYNSLNSQRTVLIIQYKVSQNLFLTGTYGKNFGSQRNLFALLGLNFGFGSSSLIAPQMAN